MGAAAGFAQVLAEHLAALPQTPLSPPRPSPDPLRQTPDPGLSAFARPGAYWPPARERPDPLPAAPLRSVDPRDSAPAGPSRPPRVAARSRAERDALALLRACGAASLREDCSRVEVRRAYRALARQFHPDCHPGCAPEDTARLAETFATITAAYRTLATPVPARRR
jgi:hypothetical protein